MTTPLRFLHLEDDDADADIVRRTLEREGVICTIVRADAEAGFRSLLEQGGFDLIIADYTLPEFDGISALNLAREMLPDVPFIFMSGTLDEEIAIDALKVGATDYVFKTRLSRIVPSVRRALGEARERVARQRSDAFLAEAQSISHTGSFGWRVATGEIVWSAETFRIFQWDSTVAPSLARILERIHPEDVALVQQTAESALRDGTGFEHEYRLFRPDRSIRHVHVVARALRDDSGGIEFVGAVMDVTERKQDERLLAGEKRLLEMIARGESRTAILDALCRLVEELGDGTMSSIRLLDPSAGCLRHGAAPSLPVSYVQAIDGRTIGPFAGPCGTAAYTGEPVVISDIATDPRWAEYRDLLLEYGLRALWSTPILSSDGRVLGTLAIYAREPRVVTPYEHNVIERVTHLASIAIEREQAEEAQLRLAAIVASSDDAIISRTLEGIITSWNAGAERTFGYTAEEAVGRPINMLVPPDRRNEASQIIDRLKRGESIEHFETIRILKDGRQIHVDLAVSAIRNAAGQIIGASTIARDITERKRAEEALRQAQAELAYVNRVTTMGELTASLAHEVRQPIAAAITDAKSCLLWLDRERPDIDEARAAALRVVEDGRRAADIISQIRLLFTKGAPQREWIDVNALIREMIVLMRGEAVYGAISARTELAPDRPRIMGDRVQMQQVLMNLIMNAIEAMKDVEGARELVIASQRTERDQVRVSVSDTGIGLPPQTDRIFDAFFTTKPHGSGMGLSISRSIVESHGGHLSAAGNRPRGATFHVTLPGDVDARP